MIVVAIIGILAATGLNTALAGQTVVFTGAGTTLGCYLDPHWFGRT